VRNPFEELRQPGPNPEVEGEFACQEVGCSYFVTVAHYDARTETLAFECPKGHINEIRGFKNG